MGLKGGAPPVKPEGQGEILARLALEKEHTKKVEQRHKTGDDRSSTLPEGNVPSLRDYQSEKMSLLHGYTHKQPEDVASSLGELSLQEKEKEAEAESILVPMQSTSAVEALHNGKETRVPRW